MTDDQKKLEDIMSSFDEAMLVTRDDSGAPRARPMRVVKRGPHGDLWFATASDSPKMDELDADPRVAVTLQSGGAFVSLTGTARIVRDRGRIDEVWSAPMKAWFPEGKDDPNLVLLQVRANLAEYWDRRGVKRLQHLFDTAKAVAQGEKLQPREEQHGQVSL